MINPEIFEEDDDKVSWKDKLICKWLEFKMWLSSKLGG